MPNLEPYYTLTIMSLLCLRLIRGNKSTLFPRTQKLKINLPPPLNDLIPPAYNTVIYSEESFSAGCGGSLVGGGDDASGRPGF